MIQLALGVPSLTLTVKVEFLKTVSRWFQRIAVSFCGRFFQAKFQSSLRKYLHSQINLARFPRKIHHSSYNSKVLDSRFILSELIAYVDTGISNFWIVRRMVNFCWIWRDLFVNEDIFEANFGTKLLPRRRVPMINGFGRFFQEVSFFFLHTKRDSNSMEQVYHRR